MSTSAFSGGPNLAGLPAPLAVLAAPILAVTLLSAPAPAAAGDIVHRETSFQADFVVEEVASGFEFPWSVAFLPDGGFLVTERAGRMRRLDAQGQEIAAIAHGIDVTQTQQGGLMDVALSPTFGADGLVYLCSTVGPKSRNYEVVVRGRLEADRLVDLETIWTADSVSSSGHHYGCRLVWRDDGTLFITLGERGAHRDEAQTPKNHFGTVVRINADGSIPPDNPFADGQAGRPDVWSYGHRNQQGAAIHPETGELWTHEHGPRGGDELNIVRAGQNHGWPIASYGVNYNGSIVSELSESPGVAAPIWYWQPSIAPSGFAIYDGAAFAKWKGDAFVGALAGAKIDRLELEGDRVIGVEPLLVDFGERIRDVRQGPADGLLYVLTDSPEGRLLRIKPANRR